MRKVILLSSISLLLAGCFIKPQPPLDFSEEAYDAAIELENTIQSQEYITGPISLYEAMARALSYNLDEKIELYDEYLRQKQLEVTQTGMWPEVTSSLRLNRRNNQSGSSSQSLLTGNESLVSSTSSERQNLAFDLTASWNLLDFGLSYVRSQQGADEVQIAEERRRKVVNRIIEDVRTVYWRAVSADRTYQKLARLEAMVQDSLLKARELEKRRLTSPLTVLDYQRTLLNVQSEVQKLQRELALAKSQLAALINLKPNQEFQLVLPNRSDVVPELPGSANQMVLIGLQYRPEFRESLYQLRINDKELEAHLISALPSLKGVLGLNYDSNRFLYNNSWVNFSAEVSWSLMEVFRYPRKKAASEAEGRVIEARIKALTLAIMTQVHVARARFIRFSQELGTIRRSYEVQNRILDLTRNGFKAQSNSERQLVQEEMNTILAEIQYDIAYADLQNAYANLYAAMGIDNFDEEVDLDEEISVLTRQLEFYWQETARVLPIVVKSQPTLDGENAFSEQEGDDD